MSESSLPVTNSTQEELIPPRSVEFSEIVRQALTNAAKQVLRTVPELDAICFVTSWKGPLADAQGLPKGIIVGDGPLTPDQVAGVSRATIELLRQEIAYLEKRVSESRTELENLRNAPKPEVPASSG
jgi:hypothetical protein